MMKGRMIGFVLAAVAIGLVAGLTSPAGAAEDKKNYPGNLCHTSSSYDFTDAWYTYSAGYAENNTASTRGFVCPAVADCGANYSTGHWVYVSNTASTITCTLYRRDASTGSGGAGSSDTTTSNDGTMERLEPTSVTTSFTYGAVWFYCSLPSSGSPRIYAYAVDENC